MPFGIVAWINNDTQQARILDRGRRYWCSLSEMAPACRVSGARVHFDVDTDDTTAVNVTEHPGLHVHQQAERPDRKLPAFSPGRVDHLDRKGIYDPGMRNSVGGSTAVELELRPEVKPTPMHVARWWATAVGIGALSEALEVLSPIAELHVDGEVLHGRGRVGVVLESLPMYGCGRGPDLTIGSEEEVLVEWQDLPQTGETTVARLRFQFGELEEVWMTTAPRGSGTATAAAEFISDGSATSEQTRLQPEQAEYPFQVVCQGPGSALRRGEAITKVTRALSAINEPVLFVKVKLTQFSGASKKRLAIAEAAVDLQGELVRAHASGQTMCDALDRLEARLRDRLLRHHELLTRVRPTNLVPAPGEWRHGNLRAVRTPFYERPREDREVVRHKSWTGSRVSVDEAIEDLEILDHDFHLFTDESTGADCLVHRLGDGTYLLDVLEPLASQDVSSAAMVTVRVLGTHDLNLQEAQEIIDLSGEPVLFYRDAATGRGNALYRRYDGHYGLITPAD